MYFSIFLPKSINFRRMWLNMDSDFGHEREFIYWMLLIELCQYIKFDTSSILKFQPDYRRCSAFRAYVCMEFYLKHIVPNIQ